MRLGMVGLQACDPTSRSDQASASSPVWQSSSVEIAGETACATNLDQRFTKQGGSGIQPARLLSRAAISPFRQRDVDVPRRPGGLPYRKGQAAMEFALLYSAVVLPLTFMLIFVSEMLWTWHTAVDFTRSIAHFAATHCWQPDNSGSNVIGWATSHVPPMIDRDQFQSNAAGITVSYFTQNADGSQTPFDGAACNGGACVPDLVSVSVTTYQFNRFSGFFRLGNVVMPPFTTVVPMESGGYQDASGVCVADATQ